MNLILSIIIWTILAYLSHAAATAGRLPVLNLTEDVLYKSSVAANLSSLAYDVPSLWASDATISGFSHPDYETIQFFTDEPADQELIIVAKKNDICYLAFKGTNDNFDDWAQTIDLTNVEIFRDNNNATNDSCEVHAGFAKFILSSTINDAIDELENCLAGCITDDCLVITGHSRGGSSAAIGAILLHRHNPTVITFGQPPTMDPGCDFVNSEKFYRYVNSLQDGSKSISFDLVVFSPFWVSRSVSSYGYFLLLGESLDALKYLGFDDEFDFSVFAEDVNANANSIAGETYSYQARISNLVENFPVSIHGFDGGHVCEKEYAEICASGSCVNSRCIPFGGIPELCILNSCEVDSDCAGDYVCIYDSCAAGPGMVEDGCSCETDSDCKNNDCVTVDIFTLDFRCVILEETEAPAPTPETTAEGWPVLDLNEEILYKSYVAANLSALAYDPPDIWMSNNTASGFFHPNYDNITFYTDEPDQAIVAKKDGICYLAFRGTNANLDDWAQNINLGDIDIFKDNNNATLPSCEARAGFADFILSPTAVRGVIGLENCLAECDVDDCLVITGHSQGGAGATIGAVLLARYDPTVITFGQPPSMDPGCEWIISKKFYRYVNSLEDPFDPNDMGFDLVVFAPNWISGSGHYGYFILLSEAPDAVKYLGFDNDYDFSVTIADNDAEAHSMSGKPYSYQSRIANLVENVPISTDGFSEGHICEDAYAVICLSGACVEERCLPIGGVTELCVYDSCEVDSDCAGDNVCIYDACAAGPGMVEDGCSCFKDSDCKNNNCVTVDFLALDYRCSSVKSSAVPSSRGNIWIMIPIAALFFFSLGISSL